LAFPAIAASVPLARAAAAAVAARHGVSGERLEALRLAVSEAVTNAVVHAYPDEPGEIRITFATGRDGLLVLVEDDGCGPDAPSLAPGLGWGCKVMDHVCDAFRLERGDYGGTSAFLRFGRAGQAI
jgi:anti-sigma regulatory factor (Ser/Thr protein kinase)